jgi:hypothetical protein
MATTTSNNHKLLNIILYVASACSVTYLVSALSLIAIIFKINLPAFFPSIWVIGTWFGWWIYILGLILAMQYKRNTKVNNKPTPLARALVIVNAAALIAIPLTFVLSIVGYGLTCTGSC